MSCNPFSHSIAVGHAGWGSWKLKSKRLDSHSSLTSIHLRKHISFKCTQTLTPTDCCPEEIHVDTDNGMSAFSYEKERASQLSTCFMRPQCVHLNPSRTAAFPAAVQIFCAAVFTITVHCATCSLGKHKSKMAQALPLENVYQIHTVSHPPLTASEGVPFPLRWQMNSSLL